MNFLVCVIWFYAISVITNCRAWAYIAWFIVVHTCKHVNNIATILVSFIFTYILVSRPECKYQYSYITVDPVATTSVFILVCYYVTKLGPLFISLRRLNYLMHVILIKIKVTLSTVWHHQSHIVSGDAPTAFYIYFALAIRCNPYEVGRANIDFVRLHEVLIRHILPFTYCPIFRIFTLALFATHITYHNWYRKTKPKVLILTELKYVLDPWHRFAIPTDTYVNHVSHSTLNEMVYSMSDIADTTTLLRYLQIYFCAYTSQFTTLQVVTSKSTGQGCIVKWASSWIYVSTDLLHLKATHWQTVQAKIISQILPLFQHLFMLF